MRNNIGPMNCNWDYVAKYVCVLHYTLCANKHTNNTNLMPWNYSEVLHAEKYAFNQIKWKEYFAFIKWYQRHEYWHYHRFLIDKQKKNSKT